MGAKKTNPLRGRFARGKALVGAVATDSVAELVDEFMSSIAIAADEDDWEESEDWLARLTLKRRDGDENFIYHIQDGRMVRSEAEGPYVASILMTVDTFLEVMDAAMGGRGEEMWLDKYGHGHIVYQGDRWIVDSERFRKVLKKMGR
jgi:hypothetical protein